MNPCFECGRPDPVWVENDGTNGLVYSYYCENCGRSTKAFPTLDEAADQWHVENPVFDPVKPAPLVPPGPAFEETVRDMGRAVARQAFDLIREHANAPHEKEIIKGISENIGGWACQLFREFFAGTNTREEQRYRDGLQIALTLLAKDKTMVQDLINKSEADTSQ